MIAKMDADGSGSLDASEIDRAILEHRDLRKRARAGDPAAARRRRPRPRRAPRGRGARRARAHARRRAPAAAPGRVRAGAHAAAAARPRMAAHAQGHRAPPDAVLAHAARMQVFDASTRRWRADRLTEAHLGALRPLTATTAGGGAFTPSRKGPPPPWRTGTLGETASAPSLSRALSHPSLRGETARAGSTPPARGGGSEGGGGWRGGLRFGL